jgi:hypothetical protein
MQIANPYNQIKQKKQNNMKEEKWVTFTYWQNYNCVNTELLKNKHKNKNSIQNNEHNRKRT